MREYTDGATAIVRGALDAGCSFFAGYPISPATSILIQMTRELPGVGGVAVQAEDEIASISMCIGAAMAGARAMTATSGPGLSLYSENVGLAVMGEVPLVIVDVQRAGPATGGATTVGQGDVQFARWGTSGGYPIIALCPSCVPECYTLMMKAFDLAERFRCPVFVLTDKELNLTTTTVDVHEFVSVPVRDRQVDRDRGRQGEIRPYQVEPLDAVPPLLAFGGANITRFTGSSHDERGLLVKDPVTVGALNLHLSEKIKAHRDEIELVKADLQPGAKTLVISYGITAGAMEEEKSIAFSSPVFFIQLFDFVPGQLQKRFVLRHRFLNRIPKISQQTEVQIFILIRQEPDFKRFDQILDVLSAYEHSRDYGQGTRFRRNSFGEVHFRQRMRGRQ
jgi:2-oxoglutarate ferredoxin oxidoreductase subunit alpha